MVIRCQATPTERTIPFQDIVSHKSATSWFSPVAAGIFSPTADLEVLDTLSPEFHKVESLFYGRLCNCKFKYVMHKANDTWLWPLTHLDDSGVLMWPCTQKRINQKVVYFEFEHISTLDCIPVLDPSKEKVMEIEWTSPLWQRQHHLSHFRKVKQGVRPFGVGKETTLLKLAATKSFWDLPKSYIDQICKARHVDVGCTLFDSLSNLIQAVLECGLEAALGHLSLRLASTDTDAVAAATLIEMDEAHEVLDKNDVTQLDAEKKAFHNRTVERQGFSSQYQAETAKTRQKTHKKRKKEADTKRPTTLPSTIPQKDAKLYLPEFGASIWRSTVSGAWCAHVPPRKRISESWAKHNSDQAALYALLPRVWRQWCELNGTTLEASCPFAFGDEG